MEILENIPHDLDLKEIKRRLHLEGGGGWDPVQDLIEEIRPLIHPRAVFKVSYIESKLEDTVVIDGMRFTSRVLRKNLDKVERVFPYVVTIGGKLEESARARQDMLEKYYLDTIGNVALVAARKHLEEWLRSRYALDGMSYMSPGSLQDWPIEEQTVLFSILGDVEGSIGVKLSESLLMVPSKSVSGMYFPTEIRFFSCQLCPREICPSRKAKYSEKMAREYGVAK